MRNEQQRQQRTELVNNQCLANGRGPRVHCSVYPARFLPLVLWGGRVKGVGLFGSGFASDRKDWIDWIGLIA